MFCGQIQYKLTLGSLALLQAKLYDQLFQFLEHIYFLAKPNHDQRLFMALCLGVTPVGILGTRCNDRDQNPCDLMHFHQIVNFPVQL